ncbi:MAG: alpha/beta hydrolase [Bacteroidota bacterium]
MSPPSFESWLHFGEYHQIGPHRVFTIDQGVQNQEAIVILHGYPSASYDYYAVLPYWTNQYRVVVHDHLGFGLSDKPIAYSYSLIEQADIALALWQKLGLKVVHLVAHDYGTSIATELIARLNRGDEPLKFKSITLGNGSMLIEMAQLLWTQKMLKHDLWGPFLASFSRPAIFNRSFRRLWADQSKLKSEELGVLWQMLIYNEGRKVLPKVTKYLDERKKFWHRWIGALEKTERSIHLVWADQDPVAVIEMAHVLAQKIPSNHLSVLPNVGHYPMLESPAIYAKAVLRGIKN